MADYLHVDPFSITLHSLRDASQLQLENSTLLAEDTGNKSFIPGQGVEIYWPVGCEPFGMLPEMVHILKYSRDSGHLSHLLGFRMIGWRIFRRGEEGTQHNKRRRRQLNATPTPAMTLVTPTYFSTLISKAPIYSYTDPLAISRHPTLYSLVTKSIFVESNLPRSLITSRTLTAIPLETIKHMTSETMTVLDRDQYSLAFSWLSETHSFHISSFIFPSFPLHEQTFVSYLVSQNFVTSQPIRTYQPMRSSEMSRFVMPSQMPTFSHQLLSEIRSLTHIFPTVLVTRQAINMQSSVSDDFKDDVASVFKEHSVPTKPMSPTVSLLLSKTSVKLQPSLQSDVFHSSSSDSVLLTLTKSSLYTTSMYTPSLALTVQNVLESVGRTAVLLKNATGVPFTSFQSQQEADTDGKDISSFINPDNLLYICFFNNIYNEKHEMSILVYS